MSHVRAILLLLPAILAGHLCAQETAPAEDASQGEIEISFVVEDDQETFWEAWREENPDGTAGPYVLALPYAVQMRFQDPDGTPNQRKLMLLADRALVWFEPPGDASDTEDDPFLAMSRGAHNLQFYGEGNIWMRYSVGLGYVTVRADRIFLDFKRSRIVTYTADGKEDVQELLDLTGRMSNVKAHDSGDPDAPPTAGPPIRTGVGIGPGGDDAADSTDDGSTGPAPSDSERPIATGRHKSLPQEQGLRLFLRADELRILSLNKDVQEVELTNGSVSSSSLAVASYSLYADNITIRLTNVRKTVWVTDPAVRVLDVPIFLLPVTDYSYDIDSQPPIRQLDFITNSRFGFAVRTYIDAVATYDFFVDPEPPFNPLRLGPQIDYFTKRGLGLGVNLDWGKVTAFSDFGRVYLRSLYINDPGDDRSRARELGWYPVEKHSRGRIVGAYSQNFGDGWQLDHLLNYSSDRNFRREFYEAEYDNNEPENSFIQLTRRYGNLNFFMIVEPKVHPWESRTEYLPTLGFDTSRVPLGDFGLTFSSHTEASVLRFQPGDFDDRLSISTLRADSINKFALPLEIGPFAFDPFVGARVTVATNHIKMGEDASRPGLSADGTFPGLRDGDQKNDGLLYRVIPFVGANLQTFFTGTWGDARVPALGIDGVRHVVAPFVRYVNHFYNSLDDIDGRSFIPLDRVDTLDEFHEVRVGIRNRIQTRLGWGEDRRTVDYFAVMAELPIYPHRQRDNDGKLFGDLEIAASWRPILDFTVAGNMFLDPITGNINRANGSLRYDIRNFGQAHIYYRLLKGQHQVVGIQGDLTVSELYRIGFKQEYDLQSGEFRDTRIELTRRILEAVDLTFVFRRDAVDGDIGFYVSLSAAFRAPGGSATLLR